MIKIDNLSKTFHTADGSVEALKKLIERDREKA